MSSSRIIKSEKTENSGISEFNFRPIGSGGPAQGGDSGFVPMDIFDSSELSSGGGRRPSQEASPAEPAGVVIAEDELNQRLQDAFNKGLQEGKNLAERGLINVFRTLRTAAETLRLQREKVLREAEDDLLRLVFMIARKVIYREVQQDRTIVVRVIRAALEETAERDELVVRINPDDYVLITTSHEDYFRRELQGVHVQLKPDPALAQGSCEVDTPMGTVDANVNAQLDEMFRRLMEERNTTD